MFHFSLSLMVTSLPYLMYGQAGHVLPQFVIPFLVLSGYGLGGGGILDLMSRSLILACLLNPMRGGWVKNDPLGIHPDFSLLSNVLLLLVLMQVFLGHI